MTCFIKNLNKYLSEQGIKQTYVSIQSGIDAKKLSRILTGVQDITATDMEKIAAVFGKDPSFFLTETFTVPENSPEISFLPASYSEEVDKPLEAYTAKLVDFLQTIDEVLSAKTFSWQPFGGNV